MPPPRETCKDDPQEPCYQYLPPGSNPKAAFIGTKEYPSPYQGTYASLENPRTSTGEGNLKTGKINQLIHFNSVQNPSDMNLDIDALYSPGNKITMFLFSPPA